ncbi:hypothetical protein CK203_094855 [Vitis vinifera]|uniref:Uncharacterized protein n=1 Tax=Vitis vinifera TaxID=29760 RepID=A0A438DCE0_VITVI|nr:hypothetical protein CK203_094855 [Vitis vinifera]
MVNLSKVMGDFVGAQKSINAQLSQRIDSVESSLNKKMDGIQNDLSQKIDNLQFSISRFANLNTVQEKENSHSQPYQNSKGIHEVEAQNGESSMVKEVKTVITLKSGKEVDLPTSKLEHEVESETEKEKREEIKGKKKGKSIEKYDNDFNVDEEPQRIVIKEEMMKKHMPPPFLQALYGKIIHSKSQVFWMIKIKRNVKRGERRKLGIKRSSKNKERAWAAKFRSKTWEVRSPYLQTVLDLELKRRSYSCLKMSAHTMNGNVAAAPLLDTFLNELRKAKAEIFLISQPRPHFEGCFAAVKPPFGTQVPLRSTRTPISQLQNGL